MSLEQINAYLRELVPAREKSTIIKLAEEDNIPIISIVVEQFLRVILKALQPKRILEIGTGIGYSALIIREACPNSKIITIEKDIDRAHVACNILEGNNANVELLIGDALEIIPQLSECFDFIFLDAAKGQYIRMLPMILEVLSVNGALFCDNVIAHGAVAAESVPHKHRTASRNLQQFLRELSANPSLITSVLPLDDGVALAIKK